MRSYQPPYSLTPTILRTVAEIAAILGELRSLRIQKPNPVLRKQNSIRTIQGSLAIEGNSFNLEQVSTILEGKRVLGKPKELREVKNAIECYSKLTEFDPLSVKSFLAAHRILMHRLVDRPGGFRAGGVGILKGSKVSHIAPKAIQVPGLMDQLFSYLKHSEDLDLIKSCVFHYEVEFIHPFEDGNGRIGRLWQTLILVCHNPIFQFVPTESQIFRNQADYYHVLGVCDKQGESTLFIEWMLGTILASLKEFSILCLPDVETLHARLESARRTFGDLAFSRLDYLRCVKTISAPTASRDLAAAVEEGTLVKTGNKRTTQYRFAK